MDSTNLYQHTPSYFSKKNMIIALVILILLGISFGTYRWYRIRQMQAFDAWYAEQQQQEKERALSNLLESIPQKPTSEAETQPISQSLDKIPVSNEDSSEQMGKIFDQLGKVETEKRNQALVEFKNNQ